MNIEINKNINNTCKKSNIVLKDCPKLLTFKNQNKDLNFLVAKKNFCNYYPPEIEMNLEPSQKPSSFPTQICLEKKKDQNEIGNKEFLELKEKYFCSENDSYKILNKTENQLLNHFFQKNSKINSISIRYRHKNSTFVYYN